MTPLEWAQAVAVLALIGVVVAAGVAAIKSRQKPVQLLLITGVLLLAVMAVAQHDVGMLRELFKWLP